MNKTENIVNTLIESNSISAVSSNNQEIVETLENILQLKIPNSFRYLLSHFDFDAFNLCGIAFYGSYELLQKIQKDQPLFMGLVAGKLFQIGRPDDDSYDPVCFSGNDKKIRGELPLMRINHEDILLNRKIKPKQIWSLSFPQMLENYLLESW